MQVRDTDLARETKSDILLTLFILPTIKLDGREHKQGLTVNISPDLISQIEKLCNEYSGGCPLYLKIQDDKEKINLELLSRKFRVKPINEMVVKFRKIKDVAIEVVA